MYFGFQIQWNQETIQQNVSKNNVIKFSIFSYNSTLLELDLHDAYLTLENDCFVKTSMHHWNIFQEIYLTVTPDARVLE